MKKGAMKTRKFYPRSAIRALAGREFSSLDRGETAALRFVMRRGRRMGVSVMVTATNVLVFVNEAVLPLATVIRLYGIAQFEAERAGQDWEARCKALTAT